MWTVTDSLSFDRRARRWVKLDGALVGALNLGDLRPYVFPFYTPRGRLVIQESPVDHPHHQGLFVGANVNGWDVWNAGSFGNPHCRQAPVETDCRSGIDAEGAYFCLTLDWQTPDGTKLLREERRIVFSASSYGNLVDVRSRWIAAYGEMRFAQTKEAGLAMRIPSEWETAHGGVIMDAQGRAGESEIFDKLSPWIDVSGEGPRGVLAGVTMMPHRDCPMVPWMVRDYGLQNYDPWRHRAMTIAVGETYELGVRYIAHDGRATVDEINAWYAQCP